MPNLPRLFAILLAVVGCASVTAASEATEDGSARPLSEAQEAQLQPGAVFRECDACPEMVVVSGGPVLVGWPYVKEEAPFFTILPDEVPPEPVEVPGPFAIGRYEVTLGTWRACVETGTCRVIEGLQAAPDELPAGFVSYADALSIVNWLGAQTGKAYALPDRASWERAAKAGTETFFWWGNEPGQGLANCRDCGSRWDATAPAPVGSFPANPFGLHDTVGNVSEWLVDCRRGQTEPCTVREVAGGDFERPASAAAASWRTILAVGERPPWIGLRVMRPLHRP